MSDNVVKLRGEAAVQGADATAKVIAWLRERANMLESGEARPAHKAVLVLHESTGDKFSTLTAYCNATSIERIGMLSLSLHDLASID